MVGKTLKLFPVGLLILSLLVMTHFALANSLGLNQLNISKALQDAGYPAIAVNQDGQNIGLVWTDKANVKAISGHIYMKTASDGATLDHKILVDVTGNPMKNQSFTPDVASDPNGDKMHVVWTNWDSTSDTLYTIYYRSCSTTSGECPDERELVHRVNNTDDLQTVGSPKVATTNFGGTTIVHVVWQFVDSGDPSKTLIYYSGKATGSWTEPAVVSSETGEYAYHPAIATSTDGTNTYVHVAWASDTDKGGEPNEKIRYRRGTVNNGTGLVDSWSVSVPEFSISSVDTAIHPDYPAVAAISDTVMILWDEQEGSTAWPDPAEEYYAAYALSHDSGSSFDVPHHFYNASKEHLSDHTPGLADNPLRGSEHAERLQIKATAQLTGTTGITAIIHAVWHETNTGDGDTWHDVHYSYFWDGTNGIPGSGCGFSLCNVWRWDMPDNNETFGRKLDNINYPHAYSMSPDIAVANDEIYVLYMEGKEDTEYDVDKTLFDVIYNGTVALTDNTASGVVYLPIILRNSS